MGTRTKAPILSESEIQRTALRWLNQQPGCLAWRRDTGAFSGEYNGKRRFVRFSESGMADCWGFLPDGRHFEAEAKKPGKRPTLDQVNWLLKVNGAGGVAFWFDSQPVLEKIFRHVAAGGQIVYLPTTRLYSVKVGGRRVKVEGPSGDFDLE